MTETLVIIIEALASSGVIWIITNKLKKAHPFFDDFAPVIAMVLGVVLGLGLVTFVGGLSVLEGITAGLGLAGVTSSVYAQKKKLQ